MAAAIAVSIMGYQQNPTTILFDRFTPDPMAPHDLVIPAGTETYADFLFANLAINRPAGFATSREGNTVVRLLVGANGQNLGLVQGGITINFENLGTPALFTVIANAGFDLNTVNEIEILRNEDVSQLSNQSPFGRFTQLFYQEVLHSDLVAAGKDFLDLGVLIRHDAGTSRTIRIGASSSYYHLIERYAP